MKGAGLVKHNEQHAPSPDKFLRTWAEIRPRSNSVLFAYTEVLRYPLVQVMRGMRQLVTKRQWFVILNSVTLVVLYLRGELQFTTDSIITTLVVLLICNSLILISANSYTDWKK
jgi:hypothetical protein